MAKPTPTPEPTESPILSIAYGDKDFTLSKGDYKLNVSALLPTAVLYLLQNGFSQGMADGTAGINAKWVSELKPAKRVAWQTKVNAPTNSTNEQLAELIVASKMDAKFAKIVTGNVVPSTDRARLSQEERLRIEIAEFMLIEGYRRAGAKPPKGDDWEAKVQEYMDKRPDVIDAEVARRKAATDTEFDFT